MTRTSILTFICPICMDDLIGVNDYTTTKCGHWFHASCLMMHVAHNGFGCPYCRDIMINEELNNNTDTVSSDDDDSTNVSIIEDEDEDEDEDEYNSTLQCVRNLFPEDRQIYVPPSVEWISQKMIEKGFTLDRFVKAILMDYSAYDYMEEECLDEADIIYEEILDVIENY